MKPRPMPHEKKQPCEPSLKFSVGRCSERARQTVPVKSLDTPDYILASLYAEIFCCKGLNPMHTTDPQHKSEKMLNSMGLVVVLVKWYGFHVVLCM